MSCGIYFTHIQIFCIFFGASALAEKSASSAKAEAPKKKSNYLKIRLKQV